MVFSSLIFLFAFLPLALVTYNLCPQKMKNALLLLASLVFYAWGEPRYILIMLFSTVFDYVNDLPPWERRSRIPTDGPTTPG